MERVAGLVSEPWRELWSPRAAALEVDPRAVIPVAVAALDAMADVVEPLAGSAELSRHDRRHRGDGARPAAWFVVDPADRGWGAEPGELGIGARGTPEAVGRWLERVVDAAPWRDATFLTLTCDVTRGRLGLGGGGLAVSGVAVPVVERGAVSWASGPWRGPSGSVGAAPIGLQLVAWSDRLQLRWRVGWSWWSTAGPGAPALARCVDRLHAEGWAPFPSR